MCTGSAIYKFKNGDSYRGEFTNNRMTGQGVMTYRNGDRCVRNHTTEHFDATEHAVRQIQSICSDKHPALT